MAHPRVHGRVDRRALLAAGTAAALFGAPAAALGAPLDANAADACAADPAACDVAETAAEATAGGEDTQPVTSTKAATPQPTPEALEPATEAVDEVVDEVVETTKVVTDPVATVVDDIVESSPAPAPDPGPAPAPVPDPGVDAVPGAEAVPAPDPAPAPAPADDGGPPAAVADNRSVGTAGSTTPTMPASLRASATTTPAFASSASQATQDTGGSFPLSPVVSSPFGGNLPSIAEDLMSSTRAPLSAGAEALSGPLSGLHNGTPSPDASSWLLATAGGLLLLVGAGHLAHSRQRYGASIAH